MTVKPTHLLAFSMSVAALCAPANATILTVFNSQSQGVINFNNTVTAAGATPSARVLTSGVASYADFTLDKTPSGTYSYGSTTMSGSVIGISPDGPNTIPRGNPLAYKASGFTATFSSAINAIGFEVGDWGTCCQPSALFISFDNGAPIQVGLSSVAGDVFLSNGDAVVFVGAFDDSSSFTTVSFWGNGVGEFLVAGGTMRYALLDQGTLPPLPEPASWAMMIGGFGLLGGTMRRRRSRIAFA